MRRFEVHNGVALLHLGRVERDDLIVQMADFCLQFEGVEWVVVSGKLDDNLVIAVRNASISMSPVVAGTSNCTAMRPDTGVHPSCTEKRRISRRAHQKIGIE